MASAFLGMKRRSILLLAAGIVILTGGGWLLADRLEDTEYIPLDHPAIQYDSGADDAVAKLNERLESGKIKLEYSSNGLGYLPSVLKELGINTDSQVLVFSKTSIQVVHISPAAPRALYFNDDVAVGFVQNGELLELSAVDPRRGTIFYTLNKEFSEHPGFARRTECLQCHQGPASLGVPGLFVSSVHPSVPGKQEDHGYAYLTDDRTEFSERWGGWYVTGTHGDLRHFGNNVALMDPIHPGAAVYDGTQNVTNLAEFFNIQRYPAPTSDIVALMTLEHQTRMTNLITRISWDVRIAEQEKTIGEKAVRDQIDSEIDEMVKYMTFTDEAHFNAPITGISTFTKTFSQRGPRDEKGRSLRDFDLKTRLFRYPLSYMIYTAAFDAMPDYARDRIYRRLFDALQNKGQAATIEIVRATKKNLPDYWLH